jgi:LemA protein
MSGTILRIAVRGSAFALASVVTVVAYRTHTELVIAAEASQGQWAQVQNVMQRREELIPALLEVTREYAQHEELVQELATRQRTYRAAAQLPDQVLSMAKLEQSLSELKVIVERNPEIAGSRIYRGLQYELAGSENRIAVERRRYNEAVAHYSSLRRTVRGRLVSSMFVHDEPPIEYSAP